MSEIIFVVFCNDSPERAFQIKEHAEKLVEKKSRECPTVEYWHVHEVPFGPE